MFCWTIRLLDLAYYTTGKWKGLSRGTVSLALGKSCHWLS